jgi:non-specific serine/threonine protein kinase
MYSRAGQHIGLYGALTGPHQLAEAACRAALDESRYDALYRTGFEYPLDQLKPVVTSDADKLPQARPEKVGADKADPLTTREREIAALVAEGLSNREIADQLIISKRTVDAHVEHIYVKLGITSRVELTNWLKP